MLRPIVHVIGPSIAYVELTDEQFSLIDSDDIPLVSHRSWRALWGRSRKSCYAFSGKISLHRTLCPCDETMQVDHINRNPLDNRRCNLRIVSVSENQQNRTVNYGSGWTEQRGSKWVALWKKDRKRYKKHGFSSEQEARDWMAINT